MLPNPLMIFGQNAPAKCMPALIKPLILFGLVFMVKSNVLRDFTPPIALKSQGIVLVLLLLK